MIPLKEIEAYFKEVKPKHESYRLDECTIIQNPLKFIKTHTRILKANPGNKSAMPYYSRLVKFYHLIKKENE